MKNLEDLFKKTTATPAIYWRPLTEQDIQRRIELRNKVGGSHHLYSVCCLFPYDNCHVESSEGKLSRLPLISFVLENHGGQDSS